jgi:long-chain acyl-CoA synthetase
LCQTARVGPTQPVLATNVADCVRASARRRGAAVALVEGRGQQRSETTWAALDADVDAAAAGFRHELRLHPGDRVALVMGNSAAFVTAYFGLLRAGLVAVPLDDELTSVELARLLGDAKAKVVVCDEATEHAVDEAVVSTHRAVVDPAGLDSVVAAGRTAGPLAAPAAGGEDLAVLMFTSGTSGRPKGAMLSHRALLANLRQCLALDPSPMTADDVVLLVLPLCHVYGLNAGLGLVAATGARAVLTQRFDPRGTLALVRDEGVTNIPGAPPMYLAWAALDDGPHGPERAGGQGGQGGQGGEGVDLAEALAGVRLMASGAAPLPPAVLEQVLARTGVTIHEGYGLTETAPVVTSTVGSPRVKPGSVGRPLPGVEVRLVDETGTVVPDDAGEIEVRGDNLFSGYWPDGAGRPGPDGWWATGDVAYADDDGDLFLVDRRKELVLVSGFNVYPREVEDAILEHPDVAQVAVIAVPHPRTGEAVKAYVVARPGAVVTAADVTAHCARRLARFKRPTFVAVVAELPYSATGKVAKGRLRAAAHADGPGA